MKVLFFDTETSGLPSRKLPLDHPDQPHLVQLAMLLKDGDREVSRVSVVVACPVEPHEKAQAAHGYTRDMTSEWGVSNRSVVELFFSMGCKADLMVAHNMAFDELIMKIAFARYGLIDPRQLDVPEARFCTMTATEPHCRIPATPAQIKAGFKRPGEFKQPTLAEALKILCGEELEGAHDALQDVLGAAKLYDWLQRNGHLERAA